MDVASRVVLGAAPTLQAQLRSLADRRLVFFAGLPGTGRACSLTSSLISRRGRAAAFTSRSGTSRGPSSKPAPRDSAIRESDPVLYRRVYEAVLRHRHVEIVSLDVILPTGGFSVYDFAADVRSLVPTEEEAAAFIATVEGRDPAASVLEREIGRWWEA